MPAGRRHGRRTRKDAGFRAGAETGVSRRCWMSTVFALLERTNLCAHLFPNCRVGEINHRFPEFKHRCPLPRPSPTRVGEGRKARITPQLSRLDTPLAHGHGRGAGGEGDRSLRKCCKCKGSRLNLFPAPHTLAERVGATKPRPPFYSSFFHPPPRALNSSTAAVRRAWRALTWASSASLLVRRASRTSSWPE